jgi:hypothetical protein
VREPEVIVPPGQEEAIERLVLLLRFRVVKPGSLLKEGPSAETPLARLEPLDIPPLDTLAPDDVETRSES